MRAPLVTIAALTGAALLAGCQVVDSERPTEAPPVSPEIPSPVQTPDSAPAVAVVDTSPGGALQDDPLWQGLQTAVADEERIYLDVHIHTHQQPDAEGDVAITPSSPDSVTVTVPAEAVDASGAPFLRLTGTFEATAVGTSAYTLELIDDAELPELRPTGPSTQERCTADDANERIMQAAEALNDGSTQREDLRLLWAQAPEVWWGIQRTAATLRDSEGEFAGDFLTEACGEHLG